ncbi:unnamed protein product [Schistosoma mattheei]|uniref:Uncharacterized protein n=1 Tax=Schistosoma mattheei TaxID=31246 RepID=A0A183Q3Y5_9TREM|nr:unnamed protein product [Schistosoma mattheei]
MPQLGIVSTPVPPNPEHGLWLSLCHNTRPNWPSRTPGPVQTPKRLPQATYPVGCLSISEPVNIQLGFLFPLLEWIAQDRVG